MATPTVTPLASTTIALVLEYIAPPSLLAPLPPHLISDALAQRHSFLNISPDHPAQYLAWPSDSIPDAQQTAVHLLESFQKQHNPLYTVRYTRDPESAFAHAAIDPTQNPPGLRLVFQWSTSDGWKFHNLALMPFPQNSYHSIQDMISSDSLHDQSPLDDPHNHRDSYWDAYGASDDQDDQIFLANSKPEPDPSTEDAYWAQYSTVHGSGDSTRPTPPPVNQKLDNERVILSYPHHRTSSPYNPLVPPCPKTLANLLANLPPRTPSPHLLRVDSDSGFASASVSNQSMSLPSSRPSEKVSSSSSDLSSALLSTATYTPSLQMSSVDSHLADIHPAIEQEDRSALKDTIRGVYRLWKAGKVIDSSVGDHDEFLEIVRQALAGVQEH